jgi:hypothetical protein
MLNKHLRSGRISRSLTLFPVCALFGCAQAQIEHQSNAMNRASGTTIGEHVFLNAIRASLDLPMSFTKLQKYTGQGMASGSFAPKIPFGPDAVRSFDSGPTLNWNPGVFQSEYVDVNTSGALIKLNQSLQYDAMDRYSADGLPPELLLTIFVRYIEVHEKLAAALEIQRKKRCHAQPDNRDCREFERIKYENCTHWNEVTPLTLEHGQKFYAISNHAQTKCTFLQFQSLIITLRLSDFATDLGHKTAYERLQTTSDSKAVAVETSKPVQAIRFQAGEVQRTFQAVEKELKSEKQIVDRQPIKFALRSPRQLLSYLGELIALQNYGQDRYLPQVLVATSHGYEPVTIFRVIRGNASAEPPALTMVGPDGETYFVPEPAYGSPGRDQTLRVLSVAAELVNGAISEKDFPAPTSITVRAVQ